MTQALPECLDFCHCRLESGDLRGDCGRAFDSLATGGLKGEAGRLDGLLQAVVHRIAEVVHALLQIL